MVEFYKDKGNHIITCVTEHKAVLDTCRALERKGKATVTYLPVDKYGMVDPDDVRKAITDKTVLISIMYANNEIGTIHPIAEIGKIAKEKGIIFHCDAVQASARFRSTSKRRGIDLASMTAHKIYGPKGIGALYVRSKGPRVRLTPQMDGGGHERGMRSGTLNVPGIVGLGKACEIARQGYAGRSAAPAPVAQSAAGGALRAPRRDLPQRASDRAASRATSTSASRTSKASPC